ncbi:hypothetical protein JXA05_00140 [Candidatus Peregrinibacteria bacterium]|nr:hypothetical protein [Candidatus Peregrinibacteria bacterium]
MATQTLSLIEFADLLSLEAKRGIISGGALRQMITDNKLPKIIRDVRGAVRLAVERAEEGFTVTRFPTALATEKINEIY